MHWFVLKTKEEVDRAERDGRWATERKPRRLAAIGSDDRREILGDKMRKRVMEHQLPRQAPPGRGLLRRLPRHHVGSVAIWLRVLVYGGGVPGTRLNSRLLSVNSASSHTGPPQCFTSLLFE